MKKLAKSMRGLFGVVAMVTVLCLSVSTSVMALSWSGTAGAGDGINTLAYFDPNGDGTTISGTIDLTNMSIGGVMMFGLVDKTLIDTSGYSSQSGAYGYFYKKALPPAAQQLRIGPSDGNNGGEFGSVRRYIPYANTIAFELYVHDGLIEMTVNGGTAQITPYGALKTLNNASGYAWNEFADGAYLGYSYLASSGTVGFNVNATPEVNVPEVNVPEPTTMLLLGLGLVGLAGIRRKFKG